MVLTDERLFVAGPLCQALAAADQPVDPQQPHRPQFVGEDGGIGVAEMDQFLGSRLGIANQDAQNSKARRRRQGNCGAVAGWLVPPLRQQILGLFRRALGGQLDHPPA